MPKKGFHKIFVVEGVPGVDGRAPWFFVAIDGHQPTTRAGVYTS